MAREKWMPYLWIKWNILSDTYTNERTHPHKIFVYHAQIDRCIYRNRDNDMQTYEQEPIVQTCQYEFWIEKLQIITVVYNLKIVQQVAIELVWNGLFFARSRSVAFSVSLWCPLFVSIFSYTILIRRVVGRFGMIR